MLPCYLPLHLHMVCMAVFCCCYCPQIDFNLVGMGWLKLQRAVFRPPAEPQHNTHQQQAAATDGGQQPAAASPALDATAAKPLHRCPASSCRCCWDPWKADSAANVAYGSHTTQSQGQTQAQQQLRVWPDQGFGQQGSGQGSGQQGSGGVVCGSAGLSSLSSQGLSGSECVWDDDSIPQGWQWSVFAEEVGCPAR